MCGIAGIIQSNSSRFGREHLQRMTDALAHRGPDGEAGWQSENGDVLLGHRRLSIIDLSSAAAQPMHYLDRYSIVHNGEIYNYLELKETLQQKGYTFSNQSDTEVILAAYDYWSDECVEHFDGMFAFAIWDKEEKELFAARDRFGEKPFYYYYDGANFLFASEIKALWAAGIDKRPNLQLLFNFITIGYTDNPERPEETFYTNIARLPAASRLFYAPANDGLTVDKYWDLNTNVNKKITDEEATAQFSQLFNTSVQRRLRSDVSIGTSLSGGLDSSSVVATIDEYLKAANSPGNQYRFETFTAIFPGFERDESAYSKAVATKFGLNQHTVHVTAEDMLADWDVFCHHQEEPFGSASSFAQYKVFQLAKQHAVKVLLDGQGADETLAGYSKYYKWYWQELFLRRKLLRSGELKAAKQAGVQERFGFRNIIASIFPDFASVVLERQYLVKALQHEDLSRDFVKKQSREAYYATPPVFNLNGVLYFNTCTHGLEELLRYADKNSMAHGREVRLPFLSHELVSFIFSLPSHLKIRKAYGKWVLRNAMQDKLPSEIVWRKDKVGFEPPQQQWMQHPKWQEKIHAARKKMVDAGILSPLVLQKPIAALPSHAGTNYDWRYLSAAEYI
jgi:asparagine synthase (glutamine-hydrolysing)